jgi:hypothetical protein
VGSAESLVGVTVGAGTLNIVIGSHVLANDGLNVILLAYDQDAKQFIAASGSAVNAITASNTLQIVCATEKDNLSVFCSDYNLQDMVNSGLCSFQNAQDALQIYNAGGLIGVTASYNIIIDAAAGKDLGIIVL